MRMTVVLEWDEGDLSEGWMNIDNLKSCLYSNTHVTENLVQVFECLTVKPVGKDTKGRMWVLGKEHLL